MYHAKRQKILYRGRRQNEPWDKCLEILSFCFETFYKNFGQPKKKGNKITKKGNKITFTCI